MADPRGDVGDVEPYRYWWGETTDATSIDAMSMPLAEILAKWLPGSRPQPHTWDDEERDILERVCLCCDQPGHYQRQLEAFLAERGGIDQGICLGGDGRVWDGHHRIVAARRLGLDVLPLESSEDASARWVRDHGHVAWENREHGDLAPNLYESITGRTPQGPDNGSDGVPEGESGSEGSLLGRRVPFRWLGRRWR